MIRRGDGPGPNLQKGEEETVESERFSYCLLFLALVSASQGQRSLQEVMRVLPLDPQVRSLACAVCS